MKKSLFNLLGVAAITWSAQVSAAGIGGINVVSALGQPLKADIELVAVNKSEKSSLVARLASPEAYKQAGLDYPYGNKFKFTIESREDGESYIHATSSKEINDPFVSLLVELGWASGKLVREFTFLLDPVGYQAAQPVEPPPVQTVAPAVAPVVEPAVAAPAQEQMVEIATEPVAEEGKPVDSKPIEQAVEPTPTAKPAKVGSVKVDAEAKPLSTGDITVRRGDTLSKIAAANGVDDVSLERMLVALYRANANQFDAKNMNRIKSGKILRMPDAQELEAISQADAKKEIHAQVSDWNAYRQKLASAAPASTQQQAAQQVSAGKISSSVADKAPVAKEGAKEVLKLSKGDALNDKVAAAGKATNQENKNAAQEEAIAKAKAADEERTRAALLEKNLQDIKHLAELKTQAAALANAASAPVAESAVAAASQVAAISAVQAVSAVQAASAVKPVAKPKPVVVETSLIDEILAEPMYLGGGAAVLLGLGGLAFAALRRKSKPKAARISAKDDDFGSTTGRIAAPVAPSPDTGDFTIHAGNTQTISAVASDDDPISEADLFLSFGRDAQAEEILKEALQTSANKTPIKLKLLEIYASRKDVKSFEGIAAPMKVGSDDKTWQQVAEMGRKIDAKNSLYGGASKVEDSDSATMQTVALSAPVEHSVTTLTRSSDFEPSTMASGTPENAKTAVFAAGELAGAKHAVMDFDVTGTNPAMPAAPSTMDFDVTATHDKVQAVGGKAESLPSLEDLVFDVTATHPKLPAAKEDATLALKQGEAKPDDAGMPFTLDFPIDAPTLNAAQAAKPAEFDLANISLHLDDAKSTAKPVATAASAPAVDSAQWHEVATKLDLAKAYQEMGDSGGAKEILDEVMNEGDAEQRAAAQEILKQLG